MEKVKSVMELLDELEESLIDFFPHESDRRKIVNALVFQMIEG